MNAESIKAIVTLVVTVALNVANVLGFALDFDLWYTLLFSIASLAVVAWSWWKNQNVTQAAQEAQKYLDELKANAKHVKEE